MKRAAATLAATLFAMGGVSSAQVPEKSWVAAPLHWKTPLAKRAGGEFFWKIDHQTRLGHHLKLMVVAAETAESGQRWIGLRPPWRKNNRVVWAPSRLFRLFLVRERLVLDLSERKLRFFVSAKRRWSARVIVGAPKTPTPRGVFALYDRYQTKGAMRPWVFETTAHSNDLERFLGDPARVALHGRHGWLRAPWGGAFSHGCIRTPDWALQKIAKKTVSGVPLEVHK